MLEDILNSTKRVGCGFLATNRWPVQILTPQNNDIYSRILISSLEKEMFLLVLAELHRACHVKSLLQWQSFLVINWKPHHRLQSHQMNTSEYPGSIYPSEGVRILNFRTNET